MKFGEYVRNRRIELGLGLRRFCDLLEIDPSNWSKVERDRLSLTLDDAQLLKMEDLLSLDLEKKNEFRATAAVAKRTIPAELYSDEEAIAALPVFFRTLSGEKPDPDQIEKLIQVIRNR